MARRLTSPRHAPPLPRPPRFVPGGPPSNMAAFPQHKAQRLGRADGSRKGGLDERAAGVVHLLNGRTQFCTTSSCSGRLVLAQGPPAVREPRLWSGPGRGGNIIILFSFFYTTSNPIPTGLILSLHC